MGSVNFGFLDAHDAKLAALGGLAERYFREDPSTAIVKLRQFAELTAKIIAARYASYRGERETFARPCGACPTSGSFPRRSPTSSMPCARWATPRCMRQEAAMRMR